jgi:hypothetical protein
MSLSRMRARADVTTRDGQAWAASELARRAASRAFLPLIDQLLERAVYILERQARTHANACSLSCDVLHAQVQIAERMLDQKRRDAKKSSLSALGSSAASAFGAPSASAFGSASALPVGVTAGNTGACVRARARMCA